MTHEIMFLNSKRQFLLLDNNTWYDANQSFSYSEGDSFLNGKVKQVMTYEEYIDNFPEVNKVELKSVPSDFSSAIFMRCVKNGVVTYNYDPKKQTLHVNLNEDLKD